MFVDIVGASEVSNYKSPRDYDTFVKSFQMLFVTTCSEYATAWIDNPHDWQCSAQGDEGILMLYPKEPAPPSYVDIAINIALTLKQRWLHSEENRYRIGHGLLPIDLGIGIHLGRTYLTPGQPVNGNPSHVNTGGSIAEGYAINLAKRVEGFSRLGKYTRIFVSESAHAKLNQLPDEAVYLFDEPQSLTPKGISRDISVFEVKHHYLPTDWSELSEVSSRSQSLLNPKEIDLDLLKRAQELNPTNLWLCEECIRSSILTLHDALDDRARADLTTRAKVFESASDLATRLCNSEHRDAGTLLIRGFIDGECRKFEEERRSYKEAMGYRPQTGLVEWYTALSLSFEVDESVDDMDTPLASLNKDLQDKVAQALQLFNEAKNRRPWNAWIRFDYGCELVRWATNAAESKLGIQEVVDAARIFPDVADAIATERYLQTVQDEEYIRGLLR